MRIAHTALAAIVATLVLAPCVLAQDAPAPKLYRWVGPDGKVHYSDDLPPEAVNQARTEISHTGVTVSTVSRAQTPEERAAAAAQAELEAKAAEVLEKAKQNDLVLLASYPNEAEIKRVYEQRIALQDESLKTTRIGMQSQQDSLSALLVSASNLELSGKPVAADLAKTINDVHAQLVLQEQYASQQQAQAARLAQESTETLARWRTLKAAAEAGRKEQPATTATPAPPEPPHGG